MYQAEKAERFRALHEGDPFVIPNPWDAGSARLLEALGFEALATTSSGFAFARGLADGDVGLEEVAAHVGELDRATALPVSADLEDGFGPAPEDAARAIAVAAEHGAVGGSIEDYGREGWIFPLDQAVERVASAVEVAAGLDFPFTLTARAENQIRGNPDLEDTIERLRAYERAGADVLYAPGLRDAGEVRAVCAELTRPVNVLAHPGLTMEEIVAAGAQRVSVGGSLAWAAVEAIVAAAESVRDGDFTRLRSPALVSELFG